MKKSKNKIIIMVFFQKKIAKKISTIHSGPLTNLPAKFFPWFSIIFLPAKVPHLLSTATDCLKVGRNIAKIPLNFQHWARDDTQHNGYIKITMASYISLEKNITWTHQKGEGPQTCLLAWPATQHIQICIIVLIIWKEMTMRCWYVNY